jgi:hypothetical protein
VNPRRYFVSSVATENRATLLGGSFLVAQRAILYITKSKLSSGYAALGGSAVFTLPTSTLYMTESSDTDEKVS